MTHRPGSRPSVVLDSQSALDCGASATLALQSPGRLYVESRGSVNPWTGMPRAHVPSMMNLLDHAEDLDLCVSQGDVKLDRALRALVYFAQEHECNARIVRDHVLVTSRDGGVLATRSAVRLASWLGY
jgi:hypothetical protein